MKYFRPKKESRKVTIPTFQMAWADLPSIIGDPGWGPQMYGISLAMYPTMAGLQLPLLQVTTLLSKLKKEATSMDRTDFNTVRSGNW
jgi:hypothetical protein